ncbi:hypothetical protein MJ1HA_1553 [Metallosphaera sedula]|nr:hypothetical protein MJ1HA_1553 [Metallosphaera sedula]
MFKDIESIGSIDHLFVKNEDMIPVSGCGVRYEGHIMKSILERMNLLT